MSAAISPRDVAVWWAKPEHARPRFLEWFTSAERERAAAYRRPVDVDRFVVGCALSRVVLGDLLDVRPAAVPLSRDCAECGKPHGKPRLETEEWFLSLSHSGNWIALAVTGLGQVGIDVEEVGRVNSSIAEVMLAPPELNAAGTHPRDLTRLWTRKEAAVKATGDGLTSGLREVRVSGPQRKAALLDYRSRPGLRLWMSDLEVDAAHAAAVAVETGRTPSLLRYDGGAALRSLPA